MRMQLAARALTACAVLLAAACSDQDQNSAPTDVPDAALKPTAQQPVNNPNALARTVQGFGGFYYDAAGTPTMYLKDPGQRGNAERALLPYLSSHGVAATRVQVKPGRFSWDELENWQSRVSAEALKLPGAVFVDADEANNRVTIGVERGKGAQVRGALARLGLPAGAAVVQETEAVTFAVAPKPKPTAKPGSGVSLQGRVRPLEGGIQINFPGFLCTLGFSANDGSQRSFITNSHCTTNQGGVDNTPYWQPLQSVDPTQIATEVEDPTYTTTLPGCPAGRVCRRADASRAAYTAAIPASSVAFGKIAKTARPSKGSLSISGQFSITAEGEAVVGQTVNKVGRTSGWSQGAVTNVCVNTNVSGSNVTELCQDFVSASVGAGDSGSPVFAITSGDNVTLLGILWGGSGSSSFVFSPLSAIKTEIGNITTH
jgi:hypothetical protein